MTATAALTKTTFHVVIGTLDRQGETYNAGRLTIDATSKEEAAELALDRKVEIAKAYNAKYGNSHTAAGVDWAKVNEAREGFAVVKIRKAPAKK